ARNGVRWLLHPTSIRYPQEWQRVSGDRSAATRAGRAETLAARVDGRHAHTKCGCGAGARLSEGSGVGAVRGQRLLRLPRGSNRGVVVGGAPQVVNSAARMETATNA